MIRAIQGLDVLSGVGNRRVLNITGECGAKDMVGARYCNARKEGVVDEYEETIWKVKPRSRPLLGEHHQKIKIPNRARPCE